MVVPPIAVAARTLARRDAVASGPSAEDGAGGGTPGTAALLAQTTGRSSCGFCTFGFCEWS
jgi:hypothetical protein